MYKKNIKVHNVYCLHIYENFTLYFDTNVKSFKKVCKYLAVYTFMNYCKFGGRALTPTNGVLCIILHYHTVYLYFDSKETCIT